MTDREFTRAVERGDVPASDFHHADHLRVALVYLKGDEPVIQQRMLNRVHRYMPPSLLGSQFETLEEPGDDEHPVTVIVQDSIAETVLDVLRQLTAPHT